MWCGGSPVKNLPASAGDSDLIHGSGRSPGGGDGNPLQYSGLENPTDRGAWWAAVQGVAESWTLLSVQEHTCPSPPGSLYAACAGRVGKSPSAGPSCDNPVCGRSLLGKRCHRQAEGGVGRLRWRVRSCLTRTAGGCRLSRPRALLPLRRCSVGLDAQLAPGLWSQSARVAGQQPHRPGWRCGGCNSKQPRAAVRPRGRCSGPPAPSSVLTGRSSAGEEGAATERPPGFLEGPHPLW